MTCAVDDKSCVYSTSPSTGPLQPSSRHAEQSAGVQNSACRSQDMDVAGSTASVGSWLGTSDTGCGYDVVDYRAVCDREYSHAVGSSMTAYTSPVALETARDAFYQRSSYQSDWSAGFPSVTAGRCTCSPAAEVEDKKDHRLSTASISSELLPDSELSSDDWSSAVSAKKLKQVFDPRAEHGRRTTQAASRRASTGSLLYTTTPDLVSDIQS